jgi:hypothetical protein
MTGDTRLHPETNLTRRRRLLALAQAPKWHKPWYSQYVWLGRMGWTYWLIGGAFLTPEGEDELWRLNQFLRDP